MAQVTEGACQKGEESVVTLQAAEPSCSVNNCPEKINLKTSVSGGLIYKTGSQSRCSSIKQRITIELLVMKLLTASEPPLFDDCAHRGLGLCDRVFKRSTSSSAQNWTPQKCKTNLRRPDKSYDISVWLGSFVAELDRKSCDGFRCGRSNRQQLLTVQSPTIDNKTPAMTHRDIFRLQLT